MMKLVYGGGEVLVSDEASHALLRYAEGLAVRQMSDTITIPVATVDGAIGVAEVLIGPASQLLALPTSERYELDDGEVIELIKEKTAALGPARPVPADPGTTPREAEDFDMDWP